MDKTTLGSMLAEGASRWGAKCAVGAGPARLSYEELDAGVARLAGGLAGIGVEAGDRVALLLPNCPQFPLSYLAAARLGAIVVPINVLLTAREIQHILTDSRPRALVTTSALPGIAERLAPLASAIDHIVLSGDSPVDGTHSFEAMVQTAQPLDAASGARPDDVAAIVYTSGTTGVPKGAMLSHHNLISNADACAEMIQVSDQDHFLCVLPLFHSFGATVCMILPLLIGATTTLMPRFAAMEVLRTIASEGITVFAGVPSMYAVLLGVRSKEQCDLSHMRMCVSGGAPMPVEVLEGFTKRYEVTMLEGYGPTEASPVVSVNPYDGVRKVGSVGLPLPGVSLKIVDDDGGALPTGEVGEILVHGDNVMQGYYQRPEDTAETVRDGWLHTGDMGRLDEDGYLYIMGRKKDLIIVGGMNVYPREVEAVLHGHPAVAEAAVVGASGSLRGEEVVAFVVLREGCTASAEELIELCGGALAKYKVPKRVVMVDELPRSGMGKVLKSQLRTMATADGPPA
ncbi:MAG: long-chain fatty acid--CoA ligase [Armatimonadota bacterium]